MNNNEAGEYDDTQKSSSWTSKLSQKLKRRSRGSDGSEKTTSRGPSLDTARPAASSQNPFARDYVSPGTTSRGTTSFDDPRMGTGQTNRPNATDLRHGQSPTALGRGANTSSTMRNENDHIGGFNSAEHRGQTLHDKTPSGPVDRNASTSNPFARDYVPSGEAGYADRTSEVRRKGVPLSKDEMISSRSSRQQPASNGSAVPGTMDSGAQSKTLPIFSQFSSNSTQTDQSQSQNATRTLQKASAMLGTSSNKTRGNDMDELESGVSRLDVHDSELFPPGSFGGQENAHGSKAGKRRGETEHQGHLSAKEIIEKAKYNSVDTTVHETIAPAVTHEIIQKQVHEITEERLTRDIHHYHHVHRILPVHEVEVLPAKHYRLVDGVHVEIPPEQVPQSRVEAMESLVKSKVNK